MAQCIYRGFDYADNPYTCKCEAVEGLELCTEHAYKLLYYIHIGDYPCSNKQAAKDYAEIAGKLSTAFLRQKS